MFFIRIAVIVLLAVSLFSYNVSFLKSKIFGSINNSAQKNNSLILENESLKTELYNAENLISKQEKIGGWNYLETKVFSTYPFSDQNMISINTGTQNGIEKNEAIAAAPEILLGQITSVSDKTALVKTIFDNNFTAAVKIGDSKTNALLKGGAVPALEMIDKNSDIKNGDIVYNADQNFPYGFKFGEVQIVDSGNSSEPFKTAQLKLNYNPALLDTVLVITNFKAINTN
jgi:cell shape-determining protein MreC